MTATQPATNGAIGNEGISDKSLRIVRGACPHDCPDTCATVTEVRDGRAVSFGGAADHPITQGWLCAKVRPYLERVYHPDRLLYPLRRIGPKGQPAEWRRISWDEAIGEITDRWKAIIAEYGAAAILPYSYSGTLGLLQLGVCDERLWNRMGASALLSEAICGAAAERAVSATLGDRWGLDMRDLSASKLIIIWGNNPASTGPHYMPFLREAQRNGSYVVVIDPRRTLTARSANEHIQPLPATDAALALGLMHVIFSADLHDEAWLAANSVGWRDLRDRAAQYPPERVASITGVPAETIIALGRRIGTTQPSVLKFADGVQRHGNGGQTARALACLSAITGQIGKRGGGLAYSTSGYIHWDAEAVGHASECPPEPRELNINRLGASLGGEVSDPPIMSLYVYCANPAASTPNTQRVLAGLRRDDLFTVSHELFMTDTAREADIVLPATSQLEHTDLHKAYGQTFLTYNAPAIAPLGEAKSNWDVMRLLAAGMGYDEPWLRQEAEEVIAEVLNATRAINPLLEGITLERLKAESYVPLNFAPGQTIPFADLRFPTPSGKVELRCDRLAAEGIDPLPDYAPPAEYAGWAERRAAGEDDRLALISGAAHHFVSSSMANVPSLLKREGEPFIELNAEDARERGIAPGDLVELRNARGWCHARAVISNTTQRGVAVSPKGRWPSLNADGRNINSTTSDALADLAGQSTFHSNLVSVRLVAPAAEKSVTSSATADVAAVFHL